MLPGDFASGVPASEVEHFDPAIVARPVLDDELRHEVLIHASRLRPASLARSHQNRRANCPTCSRGRYGRQGGRPTPRGGASTQGRRFRDQRLVPTQSQGEGSKRTLIRCWARWGSGLLAVRVLQVCDGQIVCQRCR